MSKPWSTETWEAMGVKLGWRIGYALATILFYASAPFPRWREALRRWAWKDASRG